MYEVSLQSAGQVWFDIGEYITAATLIYAWSVYSICCNKDSRQLIFHAVYRKFVYQCLHIPPTWSLLGFDLIKAKAKQQVGHVHSIVSVTWHSRTVIPRRGNEMGPLSCRNYMSVCVVRWTGCKNADSAFCTFVAPTASTVGDDRIITIFFPQIYASRSSDQTLRIF